jgi:hypothetical protein
MNMELRERGCDDGTGLVASYPIVRFVAVLPQHEL